MIKHNFPFIPPHCGFYIAQSRGTFPDPPAQTLFDLLNPSGFCLIPTYRNSLQRRSPSQSGDICTTATRAPWGLYGKEEEQRPIFLPQGKGHSLSLDECALGNPIRFLSCPHAANPTIIDRFFLACFLKKKARSPIQKGFEVDFSAVLKFTGQQLFTKTISASVSYKLRTKNTTSHRKRKTPLPSKVGSGV